MNQSKTFDVLIAGAGPSGLISALLLARCGIRDFAIIDKRPIRTQVGHASGLQPRTQEILHTLGIYHELLDDAGKLVETAFWASGGGGGGIKRSSVAPEVTSATPYAELAIQHQGRTEGVMNEQLQKRGHSVLRPFELVHYEYVDNAEYPIRAYVKDIVRGSVSEWGCKYLLAADGSNSLTRSLAGVHVAVHETQDVWLVTDAKIETDFPDFRRRSAVRTEHGNVMLIPSPRNTVRVYMLLNDKEVERLDASRLDAPKRSTHPKENTTSLLDILSERLPKIMHPYTLKVKEIEWISRYEITQKLNDSYWDGKHVLFVGDSCHSHSPKAAQGMNTGLQDASNLIWKLSWVLKGLARPDLLETYNVERKQIGRQLIDFDTTFASLFGTQEKVNSPEFHDVWKRSQGFTSGCGHHYAKNALVDGDGPPAACVDAASSSAVEPLTPGKRLLPMDRLIRHIDGARVSSLDAMPAKDQYYEVIFAGDISREPRQSEFRKVYDFLTSPGSAVTRFNSAPPEKGWDFEDVYTTASPPANAGKAIDVLVVHTAPHMDVPLAPDFDLWKYRFFEDHGAYEHGRHGADPERITVALVRPDGVVGMVCTSEDMATKVPAYFDGFMISPK